MLSIERSGSVELEFFRLSKIVFRIISVVIVICKRCLMLIIGLVYLLVDDGVGI